MNCQSARDIFPELLDRRTPATVHAGARAHLVSCPDCQREFSALSQTLAALDTWTPGPSPQLRQNFYAMLEEEKHATASVQATLLPQGGRGRRRPGEGGWFLSFAFASAVLLLGFLLGARFGAVNPAASASADDATKRELVALRKQVTKMGQLVGYSLLQQQGPANERLREVLAAANSDQTGTKILDDLISALSFDPSANVRLRALEALYAHADNATVRSGVIAALPREQNPLVQLELIDFVASAHDRAAAPVLEKMSQSETIDRSVRDAAQRALAQL